MKFVFISGGVISGLGKGILTASISLLLKSLGLKVSPVKVDMYLNVDAGTLRPQEHGETFVLASGLETDQDMGNYERFLGEDLPPENYITTGQIYQEVIRRERAFEYEGTTVEAIPHVTDEIIRRIRLAGEKKQADVVVVELGGTVGEYQNGIFFEAARIMKLRKPGDVIHTHVTYLPFVKSVGELKSKPAQTSVHILNSLGIHPDLIVARSEVPMDGKRADKIALFCNIDPKDLILAPDLPNVYRVPLELDKQKLGEKIKKKLHLQSGFKTENKILNQWAKMVGKMEKATKTVKIAMAAKYFKSGDYDLSDSYISVLESLKHAGAELGYKVEIVWVNTEEIGSGQQELGKILDGVSGIIVPQGWGSRGVEGKIKMVQYAREKKIPYLGLCFGMQMAVIEFSRNVCGMKAANSTEVDPNASHPVIDIMPDQAKYLAKRQYGATIRLGQWPAKLAKSSKIYKVYKQEQIVERHRHRYEVNNKYRKILEKYGLRIVAVSPDGKLVEAIELPNHPFFVGTQYHPELQSRPLSPHPLFVGFLEAAIGLTNKKE